MSSFKFFSLLFALIPICAAETCKKICVLEKEDCATKGAFEVYKNVVHGVKDQIAPMDPLHIDEVHGTMESVKYKLTNITLVGLKHCNVTKLKLNSTQSTYKHYVHCPKLVSHFHYEAEEDTNSPGLREKGVAKVTTYDYDILNKGKYGVFVKGNDHRPHFFVGPPETKTKLKGILIFQTTKTYLVDNRKGNDTEHYMNENWRKTETFLHSPIMKKAMKKVLFNIDIYCNLHPMAIILPYDNK